MLSWEVQNNCLHDGLDGLGCDQCSTVYVGAIMATKRCPACGEVKDVGEFGRNKSKPDGLGSYCKACMAERSRKWQAENPEKVAEIRRKYLAENADKRAEYARKRYANLTQEQREARNERERIANLTPEQIEARRERGRNRWAAKRLALYESYDAAEAAALTPEDLLEDAENA